MSATRLDESSLLDHGLARLRDLLGSLWTVQPVSPPNGRHTYPRTYGGGYDTGYDVEWHIVPASGGPRAIILVEAKARANPSSAVLAADRLHQIAREREAHPMFLAPWLSPRTRGLLDQRDIAYMDLTGNAHLRLETPAVVIRTDGADRDPEPAQKASRGLSGAQAGRLVRELVDHMPPRQPRELAMAAGVSESYVSRLLDVMTAEALIVREDKLVAEIDWEGLLRARAATYQLMTINQVVPMIARQGASRVLEKLEAEGTSAEVRVTGTYAARQIAPHAVGGALMLYISPVIHIEDVRKDLALLRAPSTNDADVLVLIPPNPAAFERPGSAKLFGRLPCVGLSQLVLDCLTGPGRMPAEAEELIDWMRRHERDWRFRRSFEPDDALT